MCWGETTTAGNQAHPPNQADSAFFYSTEHFSTLTVLDSKQLCSSLLYLILLYFVSQILPGTLLYNMNAAIYTHF